MSNFLSKHFGGTERRIFTEKPEIEHIILAIDGASDVEISEIEFNPGTDPLLTITTTDGQVWTYSRREFLEAFHDLGADAQDAKNSWASPDSTMHWSDYAKSREDLQEVILADFLSGITRAQAYQEIRLLQQADKEQRPALHAA